VTNSSKTNDTAIRVLEVLKLLYSEEISIDDIISNLFKDKKLDYELRKDVLYKYFNTFKLLGIKITKTKKMISLEKSPVLTEFSKKMIDGMKFMLAYADAIYPQDSKLEIENLIKNLCKCSSNCNFEDLTISANEYRKYNKIMSCSLAPDLLSKFRILCKERQKISFTYFNRYLNEKQKFKVEPEEVIITPTGCILKGYNPEIAETHNFYIEDIEDLIQLPVMSKPTNVKNSVTFALKGRLAAAYELKHGERVTKREQEYLVVTNSEEDKDILLKRLLRYGKACEILYPKTFRKKAANVLDKILQNYQ